MEELKNKHINTEVYIIGKGTSLQFLKKEHIGEGIIITLNEAILKIEEFDLPNITYSMQKDGYDADHRNICVCKNEGRKDSCCMVLPKKATLLVHALESIKCFEDYTPRYVFNNNDFGLEWNNPSVFSVIKVAQYMGCSKLNFLCFDSMVNGSNMGFCPGKGIYSNHYTMHKKKIMSMLKDIPHAFITPQ